MPRSSKAEGRARPPEVGERGPLRVLEVAESFATGTMGVATLVAERVAAGGDHAAIAYGVLAETPGSVRELVAPEVELFELPWAGRTVAAQLRAARALRRICREWRPDVIHLHSSFAGFVGSLAIARAAPTVYTPHGYSVLSASSAALRTVYGLAERIVAHRVSMVGAVSAGEAELARGFGARRVEIVPNGIPELDQPAPASERPADPPLVVAMGRITRARRPLETARILGALRGSAEVAWIGGGSRDDDAGGVKRLGVPVSGWLGRDEAVRRLSEATVLLHWSAWDSHPLSVLEAMALDVVVIASDIGPNRDLVGDGQVAGSEDGALALVRRALSDGDYRAGLIESQRARRGRYGAERMAEDWLRIYRELHDRAGA